MATKRYDSECEDLARYFLEYPDEEGEVVELAGVIQEAIEDWGRKRPKSGRLAEIFRKEQENDATDDDEHQY